MFAFRFLGLLFLTSLAWSVATAPVRELNMAGKVFSSLFFILAPMLYMLPTYEAWLKKHPNLTAIALVNIFLGWTLLGWVFSLVWAFKKPEPLAETPGRLSLLPAEPTRPTKACAFCAEEILAAAIKCKHCGSDVHA